MRGTGRRGGVAGLVVGVAGGYCAGKDTVAGVLAEWGLPCIDVDAVGHRVLLEQRDEVVRLFGETVLDPAGELDRRAIGRIVFRSRPELRRLESVLHPRMREVVAGEVARLGRRCVINAAILYRMGLHELCDVVLCVRAPFRVRLERARARDGLGLLAFLGRLWAQRGICLKPMGVGVDTHTVRNAGSVETLRRAVLALLESLRTDS